MKKRFEIYGVIWFVLLALFNVIAFVSPGWTGVEKYTASFWIGYAFITVTFLGQLVCARVALNETNSKKLFYKLSLLTISYTGLIVTFLFGGLCMLASLLPYWIAALVCCIVLAANILAIAKASAAIDEVSHIDDKLAVQTSFVKFLTADAEGLVAKAGTEEAKALCRKVYEAVRYSDPMSNAALASVENEIYAKFNAFSEAVSGGEQETASKLAQELLWQLEDRNRKTKLLK